MGKTIKESDAGGLVGELSAIVALCSSGAIIALASAAAETAFAAPLGLIASLALVWGVARVSSVLRWLYVAGVLFNAVAFYWLPSTINLFGGFPYSLAVLLFIAYCLLAGLQFVACGLLFRFFNREVLRQWFLAFPLAWVLCEHCFPRLFPWSLVHPFVDWRIFSLHAQYVGVEVLSFVLLWICSVVANWRSVESVLIKRASAFVLFVLVVGGLFSINQSASYKGRGEFVPALIQGNLEALDKRNVQMLSANVATYQRLSREAIADGAELILWPESVLNFWVTEEQRSFRQLSLDKQPLPNSGVPILFGGLSYRLPAPEIMRGRTWSSKLEQEQFLEENTKYFNSTFLLDAEQAVQGVYHKKILMPFGEYLPFADVFPQLKELSPQSGDFAQGDRSEPLEVQLASNTIVSFGVLICYEDLVSDLARNMATNGANVLVNLTNDAWYGDSRAPFQHHLLARWKAIETGRYLLRVTNTGYTAVVDWDGRTVVGLPIFKEGVLKAPVQLSDRQTVYTRFGDLPLYAIFTLLLALRFLPRSRGS